MNKIPEKSTKYDLEERTLKFAKDVRKYIKSLPKSISNFEDSKQLIRSSGSIGANYIEANEALSKKDFIMRLKISRKEAKESIYWLKILSDDIHSGQALIKEATELKNILSTIIDKASK